MKTVDHPIALETTQNRLNDAIVWERAVVSSITSINDGFSLWASPHEPSLRVEPSLISLYHVTCLAALVKKIHRHTDTPTYVQVRSEARI